MFFDREFYKTDAWKQARAQRLEIDNYACVKCGAKEHLEVHHRVSITKGGSKTAMYNLVTLCKQHHDSIHPHLYNSKNKIKGGFKPTRLRSR